MPPQADPNTVFLTDQEAARIANTVKDRQKKCSELEGNPWESTHDAQGDIGEANNASLIAEMGSMGTGGQPETLPVLGVGKPYPPSEAALGDLRAMKLADLKMDTHHRGRRLAVKRVSLVVSHAARSWTVVQDEDGEDVERLEVYLHKMLHGGEVLESVSQYKPGEKAVEADLFVIKEPYYTLSDQGEPTLRIDHPSDLVLCPAGILPSSPPPTSSLSTTEAEALARKYKDSGNTALKNQDLPSAHAHYTTALKTATHPPSSTTTFPLSKDILRNRSLVNLLLNRNDEAISDARNSLVGRDDDVSRELDSRAYSRAGSAAYNLGEFEQAKGFFEEVVRLVPGDKVGAASLKRIALRQAEEETGVYNFNKLRLGLSMARPTVDAATFRGTTEVKDSAGKGKGLFATRDIPAGEIIICEKAFCVVWGHEKDALTAMTYDVRDDRIRVAPLGLTRCVVQKLIANPSQIEGVMGLYGDYTGSGTGPSATTYSSHPSTGTGPSTTTGPSTPSTPSTDNTPIVDTFRIHDIVSRNAFGLGTLHGSPNPSTGLWLLAAHINHCCLPNASKEFTGDLMIMRATQRIPSGCEILHSYCSPRDAYDTRQEALARTWGFGCDCALCAAEKGDDDGVKGRRADLVRSAEEFVEREGLAHAKRSTVGRAERLARAIEETYEGKRYEGVPRVAAVPIREWIFQGWFAKKV